MSVQGVAAVLDHSRSELATRLVAISLGNHADKYGITWPSSRLAAKEAGIARETARKSIMKLRDELGELVPLVEADGKTYRPPLYWLRLPGLSGEFAEGGGADRYFKAFGEELREEAEGGLQIVGGGAPQLGEGGPTNRRGPYKEEPSKEPSSNQRRVNKKLVSEDELTLTAAVVELFNSSAGTALSTEAHLTPIVGRIRERPHYTEEHHRKIIEAVFAGDHWWTGPPTPKIIYGNASIFEQSIELARARKKKAEQEFDVNAEAERIRKEQGLD